jgi:hypothetical protein
MAEMILKSFEICRAAPLEPPGEAGNLAGKPDFGRPDNTIDPIWGQDGVRKL